MVGILLLVAACGRGPGDPTPLPLGTRVAQPTPDFSVPAAGDGVAPASASRIEDTLRTRLAQQQPQAAPTPLPTTEGAGPVPAPSSGRADSGFSVFNLSTALGILAGGGPLYSAPGGGVVVNLQVGATLTITGRSGDGGWFAGYLSDGTPGWVPVSQVRIFGDADELEVVQESLGPAVVATMIAVANMSPEPARTVVARLADTTTAPATATATVEDDAVEPDAMEPDTVEPDPAPTPTPILSGPLVTILVEGANVRAGPGTDFGIVGGLYQDERAALLGRNQAGDWVQVQLPDSVGWIFTTLVEISVPLDELPVVEPQ